MTKSYNTAPTSYISDAIRLNSYLQTPPIRIGEQKPSQCIHLQYLGRDSSHKAVLSGIVNTLKLRPVERLGHVGQIFCRFPWIGRENINYHLMLNEKLSKQENFQSSDRGVESFSLRAVQRANKIRLNPTNFPLPGLKHNSPVVKSNHRCL